MGPLIARNLMRLGFYEKAVKTAEIARRVAEETGQTMSRQRVAAILKADRIEDETLKTIAKAVGVKVAELLRPDDPA